MIITIDGPVASGKSTIARMLAQKRGFLYLNSGLLYRAYAYLLQQKGYTSQTIMSITPIKLNQLVKLSAIDYRYEQGNEQVWYDNVDITAVLTSSAIDDLASRLSTVPFVREHINQLLRTLARDADVVIDGRDAGSVIFPQAEVKIYLTASPEVRAHRWLEKQRTLGMNYSLQEALSTVHVRDERDRTRSVAPLIVPEGSRTIINDDGDKRVVLASIEQLI